MLRRTLLTTLLSFFACAFCVLPSQAAVFLPIRLVDSATGFGVSAEIRFAQAGAGSTSITVSESGRVAAEVAPGNYDVSVISENYQAFSTALSVGESNPDLRFTLDPISNPAEINAANVIALHRRDAGVFVGFVSGDDTGRPLPNVRVVSSPSGAETTTDARGYFQIHVPLQSDAEWSAHPAKLIFQKSGYQEEERQNLELAPYSDLIMRVGLTPGNGNKVVDEQGRRITLDPSAFEITTTLDPKKDLSPPIVRSALNATNATARIPRNIRVKLSDGVTIDYVSMETYVKRSLNYEWITSWGSVNPPYGTNSLRAGAVAIRSYAAWYVRNPQTSSNDICATTSCQVYGTSTSVNSTAGGNDTIGYVVLDSSGTIVRSEYSAENNQYLLSGPLACGDGYTAPTGGCLYDPVCAGRTNYGHGRGMCQWGTARWATGYKMAGSNGSSTSGDITSNGFPKKDWIWIVNHYYPTLTLTKAQPFIIGDEIKVVTSVTVRQCADGGISDGTGCSAITTKSSGATGTIIDGPIQVTSDGGGFTWWKIQWSDSVVGWSVENYLERIVPSVGAPTSLSATAAATNQVNLTWTDTNSYEAGFKVERAYSSSGPWWQIKQLDIQDATSFSDTNLFAGNTYFYRIRAYNVSGNSSYSSTASASTTGVAPTLTSISAKTIAANSLLTFSASATVPDIVQPFADFEGFAGESSSGTILFRNPRNSTSTSTNLDSGPDYSSVTDLFPTNSSFRLGSRSLFINGNFTNSVTPWIRLTTSSATSIGNPVIDFTKKLQFNIYSDKGISVAVGLRETTTSAGTIVGADGGTSGNIEWVGVTNKNGSAPIPNRVITASNWNTLTFDLPNEPCTNFSGGNSVLSTTSGLGVLEHLAIIPNAGNGIYKIYLDNFAVVKPRTITYSLDAGAPSGASVNSGSGLFTWTPTSAQAGTYSITVRATDNSSPALSDAKTFSVTVTSPPSIVTPPAAATVNAGTTTAFSVVAVGSTPLSYQWKKGASSISGATTSALALNNVTAADGANYSVVVTNTFGTATSSAATLTVIDPAINTQPQSQTAIDGTTVTFSVGAGGTAALGYQWKFNGANISGATASALTLSNVSSSDAGSYVVVVTNSIGAATSSTATLTVSTLTPYLSGAFSVVTYNTKGNGVTDWSTNSTQVQAIGRQMRFLKPDVITFNEIPNTNTYQMTNFIKQYLPGYSLATNSGTDGFIRSVIASRYPITRSAKWLDGVSLSSFGYSGNFTRDLFEAQIAVPTFSQPIHVFVTHLKALSDSDSASKRAAEARCVSNYFVTGYLTTNASHPYVLCGDMNEDINRPPSSSGQPIQILTSAAAGLKLMTPLNPFTGDERTWSIQAGSLTVRFDYIFPCTTLFTNVATNQVFRTDLLSPTPSGLNANDDSTASDHIPVICVFNNPYTPSITTPPASQTVNQTSNATFTVTASGGTPFSYQWRFNGTTISGATLSSYTRSNVQSADAGSYSVVVTNVAGSVTSLNAVLDVNIPPSISSAPQNLTINQSSNAVFSLTAAGTAPLSYQWRKGNVSLSNGASIIGAQTSALTILATTTGDAGSYSAVITNIAGAVTSSVVTLAINVPPSISAPPSSQTVTAGSNATFTISASGTSPLSYQWRFNGGDIGGATLSSYTRTGVQSADAGSYSVVVTNVAGSVTSADALLTVNVPPAISSSPQNLTIVQGAGGTMNVSASGTAPLSYQWRKGGVALSEGGKFSGVQSAALTFSAVTTNETGSYSVTVANVAGNVTSSAAILTVTVPPLIVAQPQNVSVVRNGSGIFSVSATGTAPLSYQWLFNNSVISGATASSYTRSSAQLSDAGSYKVVITNVAGSVTSAVGTLFVQDDANIFVKGAGNYTGLFFEETGARHESAGLITMKLATNAAFSGKLTVAGDAPAFSGKFSLSGITNILVLRTTMGKAPLAMTLQLDTANKQIKGQISGEGWTSLFTVDKETFSKTNLTSDYSGKYTLLFPGLSTPSSAPSGYGYGLVTVSTNGKVALKIGLGDLITGSQSVPVSKEGWWPLYVPLYPMAQSATVDGKVYSTRNYHGELVGWVQITNSPAREISGNLSWIKSSWTNRIYADGFTNQFALLGSYYVPPIKGDRILGITNGKVMLSDGNLALPLTNAFFLATNNLVTVSTNNKVKVSVVASTGQLKGSFTHPLLNRPTNFVGAVLQQQNFGGGAFSGTNQTGKVLLQGD